MRRNLFLVANNIDEVGGLQRLVHLLAHEFAARGRAVETIGIIAHPSPHRYPPDPSYRRSVLYDGPEPQPWEPRRLTEHLSVRRRLAEARRRRRFEAAVERLSERFRSVDDGIVIVTQCYGMEWVAEADTAHLRVITQSHESYEASRGWTPGSGNGRRYERIMRLYPDADLFLLLTQTDADKFERDGLNNCAVMHNPLTFFPAEPSPLVEKNVISVGRYSVEKNHRSLIAAWARVVERHPDWRLTLVGGGALEDELRRQVDELRLNGSVRLNGPSAQVDRDLLGSSIFALSSHTEGLPLVLAEAMACGVPCVSYDSGPGVREIIRDGEDGLIVPVGDEGGLADRISLLIEDEELRRRLGRQARENIHRFAREEIMNQWEEVFAFVER
jgi:glycosyltransferase involved in cell wall biosynthesis